MPKTLSQIEPKFIQWFVLGACIAYNDQVSMFNDNFPLQRMNKEDWIRRVQEKVNVYLQNPSRGPGADCGDFEADLILNARKMFGLREQDVKPIDGGVCEWCGQPNMDHMGGPCSEQRQGFKGGYRG